MSNTFGIAVLVGSLVASSLAYAAGGDDSTAGASDNIFYTDVNLVFTDLRETSRVLKHLPAIMGNTEELELESWGVGNPCKEGLNQLVAMDENLVFTHCSKHLLDGSAFRRIPIDFIAPDMTPHLYELLQSGAFDDFKEDDSLLAIPGLSVFMVLPQYLPVFREDWLEHVGFSLPDTFRIPLESSGVVSFVDHSITVDDLHSILAAIRDSDLLPDGASPVASGRWRYNWPTLFGAFGLSTIGGSQGTKVTRNGIPNAHDNLTLSFLPNVMTSQYRALIEMSALWYQEGLLDPDVFASTQGSTELLERLLTGDAAAVLSFPVVLDWENVVRRAREDGTLTESTRLVVLAPPLGHSQGTHIWRTSSANGTFMAVDADASDDEVRAALDVLDFVKLTREGFVLEHHGIEGFESIQSRWRSHSTSGATGDKSPHFPRYPYFRMPHMYPVLYKEATIELINRLTNNGAWALKPKYWIGPRGTEMDDAPERYEALNTAIDEAFVSVVTGQVSTAKFSEFIDHAKSLGALDALKETEEAGELTDGRPPPRWPPTVWDPLPIVDA